MPTSWKDIELDQILDFEEAHTGKMARFDRIVRKYEINALGQVWAGLHDLKKTLAESATNLASKIEALEKAQRDAAKAESRLQKVAVSLTVVIAIATVIYTVVTWRSVEAQIESNRLQAKAVEAQMTANRIQQNEIDSRLQSKSLEKISELQQHKMEKGAP